MTVQIKEYAPSSAKLKVLVYGKSGTGKTTFGSTAPGVLFVSSEAGLLSVADKRVKYAQINTLQDLRDIYEFLKKGGHEFESVVLDSLTDMQNHIIAQITGGKRMPQKGEWSDFGFEMNKTLRLFRDLDMHVIFLALEKDIEGEENETSMIMPNLYGSVRDNVGQYMDYVGRLSMYTTTDDNGAKQSVRGIAFNLHERFLAKARRGKFEPITKPDFAEVLRRATIEVSKERVVHDVADSSENDDDAPAPAPKPERPAPKKDKPARRDEVTDEKPMATQEQFDDILRLIDGATTEEEIDRIKDEIVVPKYRYTKEQIEQLAEVGKARRIAIREGQARIEVPDNGKMPIPDIDYGRDEDTVRAAKEVFGSEDDDKPEPPKKKAPPAKKKVSTLSRMQDAA